MARVVAVAQWFRGEFSAIRLLVVSCLLSSTIVASAQTTDTSIFSSLSTNAHAITRLGYFVFAITGAIFLAVSALLVYAVVRYRARPGDEEAEPPQVFGSVEIELSWTIIPVLIVIVLFLTTAGVIFALQDVEKPKEALDITVVGHQFWWEFRYPKLGIVTANELHIPVSDGKNSRPSYLKLTSADVDHSFWVPQLGGKVDLLPNRVNELWIDPRKPGVYEGQCSMLCGVQHAKMLLRVVVDTPEQFDAWVQQQRLPAQSNDAVAAGRHVFETRNCMNCHAIAGTPANGRFGPDLTHLMSRSTFASVSVENNPQNLKQWIADPDTFKPGVLMPSLHLNDQELEQVTQYLSSLK
jgi:cytochrome c oxidase subunit II